MGTKSSCDPNSPIKGRKPIKCLFCLLYWAKCVIAKKNLCIPLALFVIFWKIKQIYPFYFHRSRTGHTTKCIQSSHSSFPTLQLKFTGKTRTKTKTRARPRPRPNHEMTNIWTKCNPYQEQLSGTGNLFVLYESFDNYVMKINNKWIIVGLIGRLIYLMFGKFGLIHFFFLDF